MRVVIALGGNALLERGEQPDADIQETHVASAVRGLAPLARGHQLVITHGNGPQVGVLALESARDPALSRPYPFDVLARVASFARRGIAAGRGAYETTTDVGVEGGAFHAEAPGGLGGRKPCCCC